MSETVTPKMLAAQIGVSPKALRRFMRSLADQASKAGADPRIPRVGQGNRYDLSAADARFIRSAWAKAHAKAAPVASEDDVLAEAAARQAASDTDII